MLIRDFNFKNLFKVGVFWVFIFAAQNFSYASEVSEMPLVMDDNLLSLGPSAGTIVINNATPQRSASSAEIYMSGFSGETCTSGFLGFKILTGNITWHSGRTYNVLAQAVYAGLSAIPITMSAVRSFNLNVFSSPPTLVFPVVCFKVTCSGSGPSASCSGGDGQTVSLNP